jgi:hypothetical protein
VGVEDGRDVAGTGEVPFGDRVGKDLGRVQAGEFRGVQGPPQPPIPGAGLSVVAGRQGGREQVPVAPLAGRAGLSGPDRRAAARLADLQVC